MVLDVLPGTFGDHLEHELRDRGLTLGHWPQSMALSTVGGWLACRGAGQLCNRYGKIEDMVLGLDVVLADGTASRTGGRAAGRRRPRPHPAVRRLRGHARRHHRRPPPAAPGTDARTTGGVRLRGRRFEAANDVCRRRIVQRGATPAVLRLYDAVEADRSYQTGDRAVLLVMDEGDPVVVDAAMAVVDAGVRRPRLGRRAARRRAGGTLARPPQRRLRPRGADRRKGYVVDTMEIAAPWSRLDAIYRPPPRRSRAVPGATGRQRPPVPQPTPTAPACTSPSPASPTTPATATASTAQFWDAGQRSRPRPTAAR